MPYVSELVLYPVKSCAGVSVPAATVTRMGLCVDQVYDREWMVVGPDGVFLTQREHPRMACITPQLHGATLELRAPGMLPLELPLDLPHPDDARSCRVQVWDDTVDAYDCGDLAAAWFSNALGAACRLVRFHADARRTASAKWTGGVEAPTMFADGYPFLVIGSGSLDDLNAKLVAAGRAALPMNRFRPNLVIGGLDAFEEDYAARLVAGALVWRPVKPCPRCPIPSIDQATGQAGPDPLDLLATYRSKPQLDGAICFGMNAILIEGEGRQLAVGAPIDVELDF